MSSNDVLGLVGAHQQPARAPLLHPMGSVAGNVLEEMGDEGLSVGLTGGAELGAHAQRASQPGGLDRVGEAGHRHHVAAKGVLAAQENADSDHALAAHRRHLGGGAVLEDGHQRDGAHFHEVGSLQRLVGLAEHPATGQRYGFQVWSEAQQDVVRQRRKQPVSRLEARTAHQCERGLYHFFPPKGPSPLPLGAWRRSPLRDMHCSMARQRC